jgi:hypothetical protein
MATCDLQYNKRAFAGEWVEGEFVALMLVSDVWENASDGERCSYESSSEAMEGDSLAAVD